MNLSTMTSYKRVLMVLKDLSELEIYKFSEMVNIDREHSHELYEVFLPWLIDPTQTHDAIIDLFSDQFLETTIKEVMAFFCLRALSERKQIIEGSWESLVYIIIKFNRDFDTNSHQHEKLSKAKKADVKWLKGIQMLCSPNQCPNPYLRLELIRLNMFYTYEFGIYDYDHDSPREFLINALCDIYDMYSSLSYDQIYMSVTDLYRLTSENSLDIQSIINMDQPDSRKTKIIGALIKITGMFIPVENEHSVYEEQSNFLICSTFICLIPTNDSKTERYILSFIKAIHNKPILLDCMIDTYSAIDAACCELGNPYNKKGIPFSYHTRLRKMIIYMVFQKNVNRLPMHHLSRQVNGGFTPAEERQLRYFYNNARPTAIQEYTEFIDNDPFSDSSDSEYSFSDEDDSRGDDSGGDYSEEDYDESDTGEDE